ncbi:MAG: transcriptional regulator [Candidatus Acidulodesulfobacterium acidiphilum]|uniref:Transcriptional regulator n=1 Tax=Candidatus Acidulodesulfobacterium acidiphilum TaxID=2597224 RepID=A0A520XGX8_9DELT|nr:MAG: transcriptional regulator [Candidatus Acidulodesulfobacterium acidiphilum]
MVLFYIMENETNKNYCPAQEAFKVLANKWSLMIIKELSSEKMRFNAIKKKIDGISSRELSKRLEVLEQIGAINRKIISIKPIMVEYSLTEAGNELTDAIEILHDWTIKNKKNIKQIEKSAHI